METYLGLDISLTSTGYCVLREGVPIREGSIKTDSKMEWFDRITKIKTTISDLLRECGVTYVTIENYSFGSTNGRELLGEIHGIVMDLLHTWDVPFIKVPPTQVKLFGCGRGMAPSVPEGKAKSTWAKTWVVETVNQNFGREFRLADNDICDAFVIALLAEKLNLVKSQAIDVSLIPIHQRKVLSELMNPTPKKKKKQGGKKK